MLRSYSVVDVFTSTPLLGNPVAVVLDAEGLDDDRMQAIARFTNLSETTFLLPATDGGADYRLRIFTPRSELPFAGHPTLGSAHAAIESGRVPADRRLIVQQCAAGLVPIAVAEGGAGRGLTLEVPGGEILDVSCDDIAELEASLGASLVRSAAPAIVDVGAVWIVGEVASPAALMAVAPDPVRLARLERARCATGVSLFARYPDGNLEVRSFAPSAGVDEDPVCGSGNGAIALFRRDRGLIRPGERYQARQGRCVGRDGTVHVALSPGGAASVGGMSVTVMRGTIDV